MLGQIRQMGKKDKEGDRVWDGLKLSDDHLEENPNGNSKDN